MKFILLILNLVFLGGCSSMNYQKTVSKLEIDKFMGKWYVVTGRFTFLEKGAHNSVELYTWNESESRIDVNFTYNKDSFDGKLKSIPQKAWIHDKDTNAHWKISPFWPIKMSYLVIGLSDDYSWTAIGVPDGKYLWIMSRKPNMEQVEIDKVINQLKASGYPVNDLVKVPQRWL